MPPVPPIMMQQWVADCLGSHRQRWNGPPRDHRRWCCLCRAVARGVGGEQRASVNAHGIDWLSPPLSRELRTPPRHAPLRRRPAAEPLSRNANQAGVRSSGPPPRAHLQPQPWGGSNLSITSAGCSRCPGAPGRRASQPQTGAARSLCSRHRPASQRWRCTVRQAGGRQASQGRASVAVLMPAPAAAASMPALPLRSLADEKEDAAKAQPRSEPINQDTHKLGERRQQQQEGGRAEQARYGGRG